jgi:hypothetical protein
LGLSVVVAVEAGQLGFAFIAWQEVHVEVEDHLSGGGAVGLEQGDPCPAQAVDQLPAGDLDAVRDLGSRQGTSSGQRVADVPAGNDKGVSLPDRMVVEECDRCLVFI